MLPSIISMRTTIKLKFPAFTIVCILCNLIPPSSPPPTSSLAPYPSPLPSECTRLKLHPPHSKHFLAACYCFAHLTSQGPHLGFPSLRSEKPSYPIRNLPRNWPGPEFPIPSIFLRQSFQIFPGLWGTGPQGFHLIHEWRWFPWKGIGACRKAGTPGGKLGEATPDRGNRAGKAPHKEMSLQLEKRTSRDETKCREWDLIKPRWRWAARRQ